MVVRVDIASLDGVITQIGAIGETSNRAASMAINKVANRQGMRMIQDDIMDQIAFPRDYLTGDRLKVTQLATPENPVAVIRGRKRATSLARFVHGAVIGRSPVGVEVKRGNGTTLRKAWLVRLNKGTSLSEDSYNVGLAVRLKAGDTINNKNYSHRSWFIRPENDPRGGGVALLYGPSVDQIFRDVADKVAEPILRLVAAEYWRNMERLL